MAPSGSGGRAPGERAICLASDLLECTGQPRNFYEVDQGDYRSDIGSSMCHLIDSGSGVLEEQDYLNPDGFLDLEVEFEARDVQVLLRNFCDGEKGQVSESLVITGATWDGIPIYSDAVGNVGIDQLLKVSK